MEQVIAAVRGHWSARAPGLHAWIAAERGRFDLWLPVLMGVGVLVYFDLRAEPVWWAGASAAAMASLASWLASPPFRVILLPLAALAIGFTSAQLATVRALPLEVLPKKAVVITGTVRGVEMLPAGRRVTIEEPQLGEEPPLARSLRVRLRNNDAGLVETGDTVRVRALVRQLSPPAYPGGWDFQRDAFYAGMAGSGFALGLIERVVVAPPRGVLRWIQWLRDEIGARVRAAVPGAAGAVCAAFLNGLQSGIPKEDQLAFQGSGLAHLLSVSGLHITIVMGFTMALVRTLLALSERAALRWPCRQIAAVAALAVGGFYTVLTGTQVPMLRSFAMASLFTLALLAGRRAVSMRGLALAAVVVILAAPNEVVGASLQMSFSAVLALIAGYEVLRTRMRSIRGDGGWHRRFLLYFAGLALTSALAGTASMPFAAYHFGRIQLYYILSNMIAVPLSGVLMPAGMISLLLMPFGLEKLALVPMAWGMEVILWIAHVTAALPAATLMVPRAPPWGLALFAFGLAWAGIWRGRVRLVGLAVIAAGLLSPVFADPPDILVSDDARLIGLRTPSGIMLQNHHGGSKFTREVWGRFWAEDDFTAFPESGEAEGGLVSCTERDCLLRPRDGAGAAILLRSAPGEARCEDAVVVLSAEPAKGICPRSGRLIDRFTVWRNGAHAIWLDPSGPTIVSDRATRGDRPWVPPLVFPKKAAHKPPPPPEAVVDD
jgi:competence protein ComEC